MRFASLLLAALLFGCGGDKQDNPFVPVEPTPTPQPTPDPTPTPLTTPTPTSDPTPQPTPAPDPAAPLHIGNCRDIGATTELVRRVADLMGLGDDAVRKTHIYCDPWTPGPDGRNFQTIALTSTGCTPQDWAWLFGCANGVGSPITGVVSLIRMSPDVMAEVLRQAREQNLSVGPHSDPVLMCMWSLHRTGIILIHEWHHAHFGLVHGPEMFAEDDKVKALLADQHGDWLVQHDWAECPLPEPEPTPTPTTTPTPTPTPIPTPTPQPTPTPEPVPPPDEPLPEPTPEPTQQELWLAAVNDFRAQERVCGSTVYSAAPPLRWNNALEQAAIAHSTDMAENDFFNHIGSDGSGFSTRAFRAGYRGVPVGENIAAGTRNLPISLWAGSPGHCAHMMAPQATVMGVGHAFSDRSTYGHYWTYVSGIGG